MKKTIFIIGGAVFLTIILIYVFKSPQAADSGVSVVDGQGANGVSGGGGESAEIVRILSMLNKVSLKTDFFEDKVFLSLEDLSVQPVEGEMGKNNPFSSY